MDKPTHNEKAHAPIGTTDPAPTLSETSELELDALRAMLGLPHESPRLRKGPDNTDAPND